MTRDEQVSKVQNGKPEDAEERRGSSSLSRLDKNALFELVLNDLGGFGRFQKLLLALSLISSSLAALNHLGPIYLAYTPKFGCEIATGSGQVAGGFAQVIISSSLIA